MCMAGCVKTTMKLLLFLLFSRPAFGYFADWSVLTRDRQPMCVDIPKNMSLCHNIGYNKMRLPNLLEHDTMQEVSQQASSWVPLLNIKCHEDSQLFLCSLFAPVCLERPIYPCRSLCEKVKGGCEGVMQTYGFPWPSMLDCSRFPLDNDMCITSQSEEKTEDESTCQAKPCNQAPTVENILNNFCQADFVIKMKFRKISRRRLFGRKVDTVFKAWRGTQSEMNKLRKPKLSLLPSEECCADWLKDKRRKQRYLVMGKVQGEEMVPTFVVPWSRDKEMRRARRMFKQIDCTNLRETSQKMLAEAIAPHTMFTQDMDKNTPERRRRKRNKQHRKRHQKKRRQQH